LARIISHNTGGTATPILGDADKVEEAAAPAKPKQTDEKVLAKKKPQSVAQTEEADDDADDDTKVPKAKQTLA